MKKKRTVNSIHRTGSGGFYHVPVFQWSDRMWYYWTETWAEFHGPFKSETNAWHALEKYIRKELNGEKDRKY